LEGGGYGVLGRTLLERLSKPTNIRR